MTFRPPLSSQSEVVNTNRRWNQDWYTWLSDLATAVGVGGGGSDIIISATEPASPTVGQLWFNPATQLISIAGVPSYAWSNELSAGSVVLSGSDLIATRSDASYPEIVTPDTAGARSISLLPSTQKYLFSITTNMDLSGDSGFGICNQKQTVGNGMFLGFPNPSQSIGYYVETLAFYFWVNNAGGFGMASPISNGLHYVAIDPVAKKMWVMPLGGTWDTLMGPGDPATGVGGVPFTFDVTTSRIAAQFAVDGDAATIDASAAGLAVTGFTPLSEVVLWTPLTYINPSAISGGWINIRDFGAIGDGTAEDGPAFQAFTAAYQGKDVILYIPPGMYQSGSTTLGLWSGIRQLTIIGYGASINGNLSSFGGIDDKYGLANSALVQSAFTGDVQLTLVSGGDASKFAAGDWILLGALDIQGDGIPPNPHYMEFVQITSISGSTIFLDNFIRGGPYLSTYPYYSSNSFGVNEGGPATIWNMTQMFPGTWDVDIFVYGLTFLESADMPTVRSKYYKDCQWPGLQSSNWPPKISQGKSIVFDHCLIQGGGSIEIDKCIERLVFKDCDIVGYYNELLFQSSSVQQLIIDRCNILSLSGTPRNTYIRDSWIDSLIPTPRSNGIMESLFAENSFIRTLPSDGWGASFGGAESISGYTFSNGTLSKANVGGTSYIPWACPGAKCIFQSSDGFTRVLPSFTVLDVRGDGGAAGTGNVHIDTTLSSIPTWTQGTLPSSSQIPMLLVQHPYSKVFFKNCRGSRYVTNWQDIANPTKDGGTGLQYANIILTGDTSGLTGASNMHVEGTLIEININVLRAYSGANGTENLNCAKFDMFSAAFVGITGPAFVVDAKTVGLRAWSNGSWTGSVGGDALPVIASGSWVMGYIEWYLNNSMAGDTLAQTPIIFIEVITDAGIIKYQLIDYGHTFVRS